MKRIIIIITCIVTALAVYAAPPKLYVENLFDGRYNDNKSVTISIRNTPTITAPTGNTPRYRLSTTVR